MILFTLGLTSPEMTFYDSGVSFTTRMTPLWCAPGLPVAQQPKGRLHGAVDKRQAAAGAVADFNPLALGQKQGRVFPNHIATADGGKADGIPLAPPVWPLRS